MKTTTEIRDWLLANAIDYDGDLMLDNLDFSEFDGDAYIDSMKVKGYLWQHNQEVQGDLWQSDQEVQGDLYNRHNKYGGNLHEEPSTKILKEITSEELAELGYKLKGEN